MKKNNTETKQTTSYSTSTEYAKRVIKGEVDIIIDKDKITYTYNKETNILTLADSFGESKYRPLIVGDTIFPFNKRIRPEEL